MVLSPHLDSLAPDCGQNSFARRGGKHSWDISARSRSSFLLGFWAAGLILGFALLQYGAGEHVRLGTEQITFGALVYHSGETFFTLGYGDILPAQEWPFADAGGD